jgi:ATP-dependent DNA helicase DinG
LKQSVVVLSLVPPQIIGKQWYFTALRVEQGLKPRYFCFSIDADRLKTKDLEKHNIEVVDYFKDSIIVVFDLETISLLNDFLGAKFDYKDFINIRELLIIFYPSLSQYELQDLSTRIEIKENIKKKRYSSPAHRNVRLCWEVLNVCWHKGLSLGLGHLSQLREYTQGSGCEQFFYLLEKEIIRQYPDRSINKGLSTINTEPYLFAEDDLTQSEETKLSSDWVVNCFRNGGLLSKNFPGYENRTIQVIMAEAITNAFIQSRNTIIEAGTGTGKSLAYLIPALWWAKKNKKRVVVATHTITLQEQLFFKDLPFLQKIMPFRFNTVLLKGKNNYLCLQNFYKDKPSKKSSPNDRLVYCGILSWIQETSTGDFSEISYLKNLSMLLKEYGADNPYCFPGDCQFTRQCYLLKARRKAEDADLIVINHSLLLADIKTNNKILPEYNDLIIDEAHNVYQTALKQLGFEISLEQILRMVGNLSGGKGSLANLVKKNRPFWLEVYPNVNWAEFDNNLAKLPVYCTEIKEQSKELFSMCQNILEGRLNIRIDESKIGRSVLTALLLTIENLICRLTDLVGVFNQLNSLLHLTGDQLENVKFEIQKNKNDFTQIIEGLKTIVINDLDTRVTYLERNNVIYLKNTFVDIVGILKEKVFNKNNSTILTSATLTVADNFDYFARDIGVEGYKSIKLDSPFDYDKQMLFCVVNDLQINQCSDESLASKTAFFIRQIAEIMDGRTLVLFTSHRYLRLVNSRLQHNLINSQIKTFAQGIDGARDALLQDFLKNKQSILLGTSSFWEGIDIPGDSLKCVIMTKLPFWPPDSPILEAKARLFESRGQNSFHDLYLPEAIIRFKQGFGRLIRTENDRGVVILLDDRILKKYYGKYFIKSLPILSYFQGSSQNVITQIGDWV